MVLKNNSFFSHWDLSDFTIRRLSTSMEQRAELRLAWRVNTTVMFARGCLDRTGHRQERLLFTDWRFPNEQAWTRRVQYHASGDQVISVHRIGRRVHWLFSTVPSFYSHFPQIAPQSLDGLCSFWAVVSPIPKTRRSLTPYRIVTGIGSPSKPPIQTMAVGPHKTGQPKPFLALTNDGFLLVRFPESSKFFFQTACWMFWRLFLRNSYRVIATVCYLIRTDDWREIKLWEDRNMHCHCSEGHGRRYPLLRGQLTACDCIPAQ